MASTVVDGCGDTSVTRILLIDFHDSFTYNLRDLVFRAIGVLPDVVRYDDPDVGESLIAAYDALILSPGPGDPNRASDVGAVPELVARSSLPVLGVCLGHEILALLSGATVARVRPCHGQLSTLALQHGDPALVANGMRVVRYHSLAIHEPGDRLIIDAVSEDGVIQAIHASDRPWWGVQFHPESVRTDNGVAIIRSWAQLVGLPIVSSPEPIREASEPPRFEKPRVQLRAVEIAVPDAAGAFRLLSDGAPFAFWLDSVVGTAGERQWSFLGAGTEALIADAREVRRYDHCGNIQEHLPGGMLAALRSHSFTTEVIDPGAESLPLQGGWVGVHGYEARRELGFEVPWEAAEPEAMWMRAGRYLAIDHHADQAWLVAEIDGHESHWLRQTAALLAQASPYERTPLSTELETALASLPDHRRSSDSDYRARVRQVHEYLRAGETYEVCLTTRAEIGIKLDADELTELYLRQREANPAPYAAYVRVFDTAVLSSSPERFLRVEAGRVETKPIKGTTARVSDAAMDAKQRALLLSDAKTGAELLMITDLLRNDLARVCVPGTVATPEVMRVESFATVHQLMSRITGTLAGEVDGIDLLAATFPGGSMTGAPKERTMSLISQLEGHPRGLYSGVLGFFSGNGNVDLSIVIRSLIFSAGTLSVSAGGAVVLDSTPQGELDEMLLKLAAPIPVSHQGNAQPSIDENGYR